MMMKTKTYTIDVGLEFSKVPSGRFQSDGNSSAEAFFIHTLDGLLSEGSYVNLEFHNVLQAGSTFLYHLSGLLVNYGYDSRVTITKDDECEWTIIRWDKYMKQHKGNKEFIMSNTIYELSNFDYMYDSTFYYQFKNDDTVAWRVKALLREQLRYDSGYFEGDVRYNMELLHLLKGVVTIDGVIGILESSKVNWDLKEKELL